jgi:hypothetical protein
LGNTPQPPSLLLHLLSSLLLLPLLLLPLLLLPLLLLPLLPPAAAFWK